MAGTKNRRPGGHKGLPKGMRYADYVALEHARAKAVMEAAQSDAVRIEADTHTQRAMWLMVISIANAYGFGAKRMAPFFEALQRNSEEFSRMEREADFEYALEKLRLKAEAVTGTKIGYLYEAELAEAARILGREMHGNE